MNVIPVTEQENTEVETSPIYPGGEMTPNSSGRIEPAPSRPGIPPYQRQVGSERGPEKDPEGASQLDMPLETDTDVKELYRQEWPGLPTQRRDVWRPAVNWLTEPVQRPPKPIGEKLESYSDVCRKRLASRNNSSAVKDRRLINPSVSPVLKATGRPEGGVMPATVKGTGNCMSRDPQG